MPRRKRFMDALTAEQQAAHDDQLEQLDINAGLAVPSPPKLNMAQWMARFLLGHGTVWRAYYAWCCEVRLKSFMAGMRYASMWWAVEAWLARAISTMFNGSARVFAALAGEEI